MKEYRWFCVKKDVYNTEFFRHRIKAVHKILGIFQKGVQNLSKRCSKKYQVVAFVCLFCLCKIALFYISAWMDYLALSCRDMRGLQPHPAKCLAIETRTRDATCIGASQRTGRMMVWDESHPELSTPKMNLLTPKPNIKIGCWKVRTLYQTDKLAQTVKQMHSVLWAITLWNNRLKSKMNRSWKTNASHRWYEVMVRQAGRLPTWRRKTMAKHRLGILINDGERICSLENTLLKSKSISNRLARFNSKFAKLSTIRAYAPTEGAEEDTKNTFYESLQATVEVVLKHDVLSYWSWCS